MVVLNRYASYSRKDVHALFSPDTKFTPQAGTWGLQGIIRFDEKNYVFFVTYGQKQGTHTFHEDVNADGLFSWQSQPRMSFRSPDITNLIHHDAAKHQIYLFLRTKKSGPYTYLGQLEYVRHDPEREKPVHFCWKIIDWDARKAQAALPDLVIAPTEQTLPLTVHTFTWLTDHVLIKQMDRSDVLAQVMDMPAEILPFWRRSPTFQERNEVHVKHLNQSYALRFEEVGAQTRMRWGADFSQAIRTYYPQLDDPTMAHMQVSDEMQELRFSRVESTYFVDFLANMEDDIAGQESDVRASVPLREGGVYDYTSVRYERDPRNRRAAIRFHGVTCFACGFNFEEKYGSRGVGFIEIHHVTPLHTMENEAMIDPEVDLIPLCSNCHRMVHRNRSKELTLEELRQLIQQQQMHCFAH